MIFSLAAVDVNAAPSTERYVDINMLSPNEASPGDVVTVELNIDSTANINALSYTFHFNPELFEINETTVDSVWYDDAVNGRTALWDCLKAPHIGFNAEAGTISVYAGALDEGDAPEYNEPYAIIGKFHLKVKMYAPSGYSRFTLSDALTLDAGADSPASMSVTPNDCMVYGYCILTIVNTPKGSISLNPAPVDGDKYLEGTEVTLTAVPNERYRFVRFTGDLGEYNPTQNPLTISIYDHITIGATFELISPEQYAFTIGDTTNGSIMLNPAPQNGKYFEETVVTATAIPNYGYSFVRFTGASESTVNPIQITIDGDKILGAIFEAIPTHTVTYNLNGGSGTPPAQAPVMEGAGFTVAGSGNMIAPLGKRFKEWNTQENGSGTSYAPGAIITMGTSDITLYALWEDIPTLYADYVIDISSAAYSDATQSIGLSVTIYNIRSKSANAFLSFAVYTSNNKLLKVKSRNIDIQDTQSPTLTDSIALSAVPEDGYIIKVFLWDSMTGITPLAAGDSVNMGNN